ncbi:MAG: hypothetical protein R8M71_04665 [Alphaproteobacteria bacterium]|jgi:hypothetical protein|nr:hypothetical protein [Alphaproteobacteria bacterium]
MFFASSKKAYLKNEIERLEQELRGLSDVSESQIGYKVARLKYLKQKLAELDKNKFQDATNKLKQDMNQQDMMTAMAAAQGRND